MAMVLEDKNRALDLFQVPPEFRPEALKMLTEQELALILLMEKESIPEQELIEKITQAGLAKRPEILVRAAYSRAVLQKVRDEHQALSYQVTDFYTRYPYYAQFEYEEYARIPAARKKKLNEWDFALYFDAFQEDVKARLRGENVSIHDGDFMTLEQACEAVMAHDGPIYQVPCNCKCMMDLTERPRDTCVQFRNGDNTPADRGHGKLITVEQTCELLKSWNSRGLMANGKPEEEGGFCNCDCPSCYPIMMAKKLGARGVYPRAYYTIHWDAEKCVHCGKCTKVCNFEAFTQGENRKVTFDPDKCWGCTVCTNNCPRGAITKTPIPDAVPKGPAVQGRPIH